MANVLTDLAADIYKAGDIVGRELTGYTSSVLMNTDDVQRAALGDTIRSHVTEQPTVNDVTPSMTIPEGDDQTVGSKTMTINKSRAVQIPWTGEDIRHVNNGAGFETIYGDQIRQAMRRLVNEIEGDIATEAYQNASRAVGTAGTTPFSSNFDLVAEARQILVDNGTPMDGMSTMVLNTLAGTNLRNLAQLQKANEAGGTELLRQGALLDLQGLMLKESAGVQSHTKGTGTGYLVNSAGGLSEGATQIPVDTGSGTIVAGDVITINGDSNKYIVKSFSGGTITIADPGLRQDAADDAAVTIGDSYTANAAFHRNALELVMRPPAIPSGGDQAEDAMTMQDPFSGLTFEVRAYKGYKKAMFEVAAAWGTKAWNEDFIAAVLG